ncbi:hypothetical protein PsorP6_012670 [Peronosclerospora sorghi]|uniref:Uncharacterized protein n=1 Tax=Peronosclerospora sorghi TaxID=230839 RepID=A0ACC0WIB8_9STRA|nr:hypothetical protein PsorP6_012670 [Peronosclerospora sorghi]
MPRKLDIKFFFIRKQPPLIFYFNIHTRSPTYCAVLSNLMRLSYLGLATTATLFASYGPLVAAIRDGFENADAANATYTVSTGNDFPQEDRAPSRLRLVGRGNMKRTMAFPPNTQAATALYNYLEQYVGDDLASRYHHSNQVRLEIIRQLHGQGLTPSDLRDHFSNTEYNIDNHPKYIPALFYDLWEEAVSSGRLN